MDLSSSNHSKEKRKRTDEGKKIRKRQRTVADQGAEPDLVATGRRKGKRCRMLDDDKERNKTEELTTKERKRQRTLAAEEEVDFPSSDLGKNGRKEKRKRTGERKKNKKKPRTANDNNLFGSTEDSADTARKMYEALKLLMSIGDVDSRPDDLIRLTNGIAEVDINRCTEYLHKIHDHIVELKQKSIKPNWSELPNELLESILIKLVPSEFDIAGFRHIRDFKAVCKSWRAAAKSCSTHVPLPRTPCLLLHDQVSSLFDPIGNKRHKIRNVCDYFYEPQLVNSSCGWIVMFYKDEYTKESKGHLFNPITRASIPIPGEQTLPNKKCEVVSQALISSNPSYNMNFVVVVEYGSTLAYYKHGDEEMSWKKLDDGHRFYNGCLVFHDDHLFASKSKGLTEVWNFKEYPPLQLSPIKDSPTRNSVETNYLIESLTGEVLRLGKCGGENISRGEDYETLEFCVEKLNLTDRKWENMPSLGDQSLFLFGEYIFRRRRLMSLSNPCFLGCEKNSIYFGKGNSGKYVRYDLEKGKVESVIKPSGEKCAIKSFIENIHTSSRYTPLWVIPNPW